eukprot:5441290-Pyramimonas_sp.AAC.1
MHPWASELSRRKDRRDGHCEQLGRCQNSLQPPVLAANAVNTRGHDEACQGNPSSIGNDPRQRTCIA